MDRLALFSHILGLYIVSIYQICPLIRHIQQTVTIGIKIITGVLKKNNKNYLTNIILYDIICHIINYMI